MSNDPLSSKAQIDRARDAAANFAYNNMKNPKLRAEYVSLAQKSANEMFEHAQREALKSPEDAHTIWRVVTEAAVDWRNAYLEGTRGEITAQAKALSLVLKETPATFQKLISLKTDSLFKAGKLTTNIFDDLALAQQKSVYMAITESSGRTNMIINNLSKYMKKAAPILIIVAIGIMVYNIATADNHVLEAVNQAVQLGFGLAGGIAGAELGAAIGAAGGPIGVAIGAILGGIVGGFLSSLAGQSLVNVLYGLFCPKSEPGAGPPSLKGYGPLFGPPHIKGDAPQTGPPSIKGTGGVSGPPRPPGLPSIGFGHVLK